MNYGPAPILHITAHTVGSLCTNLSPKLPPGGLKPGQSISFDNNWDPYQKISARAARSFVEQVDENVAFGQTMQTSRNAVTANVVLKFGQTLILSGLAEQEVQRASDGVPVLQDIPVLQYLFRARTTDTFRRSVVVLITPRKPQVER